MGGDGYVEQQLKEVLRENPQLRMEEALNLRNSGNCFAQVTDGFKLCRNYFVITRQRRKHIAALYYWQCSIASIMPNNIIILALLIVL